MSRNEVVERVWRKCVGIEPTTPLLEALLDLKSRGGTSHHPLPPFQDHLAIYAFW